MSRFLGVAFAAMTATACLAYAAEPNDVYKGSVTVPYSDLDLASNTGAHAMLVRLKYAAVSACGGAASFNSMYNVAPDYVRKVYAKCQSDALAGAVASLHAPLVSTLYAESQTPLNQYAGR